MHSRLWFHWPTRGPAANEVVLFLKRRERRGSVGLILCIMLPNVLFVPSFAARYGASVEIPARLVLKRGNTRSAATGSSPSIWQNIRPIVFYLHISSIFCSTRITPGLLPRVANPIRSQFFSTLFQNRHQSR